MYTQSQATCIETFFINSNRLLCTVLSVLSYSLNHYAMDIINLNILVGTIALSRYCGVDLCYVFTIITVTSLLSVFVKEDGSH